MNIHIACPFCGCEWEDKMSSNRSGLVDISEVHGAKVISQAEGKGGAIKLVQIDDVYLLLIVGGKRERAICKVVNEETATPMYTQALQDFIWIEASK